MSLIQSVELWGNDIPWLAGLREKGVRSFENHGIPNAKTEAWKYSFFNEKDLQNPQIDTTEHPCNGHCHQQNTSFPLDVIPIHYCDGRLHSEDFPQIPGLIIKPLIEAIYDGDIKPYLNKSYDMEQFPFAALNTAYLEQGLFILLERNTALPKPLYIRYHYHQNKNLLCTVRNIIVIESNASATIIEHFEGETNTVYTQNIVNEIYIGQRATLSHFTLQDETPQAHHFVLNSVEIKNAGKYKSFCAQKGGKLSRQESLIKLLQQSAEAEVCGVYKISCAQQTCDMTTNIRHMSPHTFSNQLVKGIAAKAGKGVFQGQIHIAPQAQQCEGYQLHRALLLDKNAEIDCKPELEIFADDVKCSHGAASGDLDKEQLFYLQSRGISRQDAQQILIDAYLDEVFAKISDENIRLWLEQNF